MVRDQILATLRTHEPELRAAGIDHVRLFGSVARNEQTPQSDVDLAVDIVQPDLLSLFAFAGLQGQLSDLLGRQVDLSERKHLRPHVRPSFESESIIAF